MEQELQLVADFDFDHDRGLFFTPNRQGPGSQQVTRQALSFIGELSDNAKIADIGCGSGGQTITLAENTKGQITAIDLFPKMITLLKERAIHHGLSDRISGIAVSMENLPFEPGELDLIWAEGSIYNIGFERGLREWKQFLKPGGMIAVSEVSWLTNTRPDEIEQFWNFNYAEIDTISNKIKKMEEAGYSPVAHFILPEYCWLDCFYKPMQENIPLFLEKYKNSKPAQQLVQRELDEIDYYRKYKSYYGYVFYIGMKNE